MNTASIKKELHQLGAKELWEIVSYAQSLLQRKQLSASEELAFLEAEYEAAQHFQLSDAQLSDINRRRTALLNGTDKGQSHESVMKGFKLN